MVDKIKDMLRFTTMNSPAAQQRGGDSNSVPNKPGLVDFSSGIITGNRTINPLLSMIISGDDDGKVFLRRAQVKGMSDFVIIPHSYSCIMSQGAVILQTIFFCRTVLLNTNKICLRKLQIKKGLCRPF